MNRLDEIKARRAAATPGPWQVDGPWYHDRPHVDNPDVTAMVTAGEERIAIALGVPFRKDRNPYDLTFIAHAPDDMGWLVAEVERLEAENARSRQGVTE